MLLRAHPEDQNSLHFFNIQSSHSFFSSHVEKVHPLAATCDYLCKLYHIVSQSMHMNYGVGYVAWTKFVIIGHNPLLPIPTRCRCPSVCVPAFCFHLWLLLLAPPSKSFSLSVRVINDPGNRDAEQLLYHSMKTRNSGDICKAIVWLPCVTTRSFFSYLSIIPLYISKIRILNPNLSLGTL